jgi:hypothetical protein
MSALERLRQKYFEFEASLGYRVRPYLKKKKKKRKEKEKAFSLVEEMKSNGCKQPHLYTRCKVRDWGRAYVSQGPGHSSLEYAHQVNEGTNT